MSGEDTFQTPATGQDNSPTLGDDLTSILDSGRSVVQRATQRLTASTREINQPARQLDFADPPIDDIQEEQEPERQQDITMADDESTDGTATVAATTGANATILDVNTMFKVSNPKSKTEISGLTASVKRADRNTSVKDKQKIKSKCTQAIEHPFDVPLHYVSSLSGESEGTGAIEGTDMTDAFIATSLKTLTFKDRCTEYDIINVLLIPKLKNATATTPADRWDFSERVHFLDHHGTVSMETCKLWVNDCVLWDASTFEAEDMDWLLTFAKNSCSTSLRQKVDEKFNKLANEHRGGVTYLKLMYEVMIFVNDSVIVNLQQWIKKFGDKGLMMFPGESVQRLRLAAIAVCTRLSEANRLPEDAVEDILKGLCRCSHVQFVKQFDTLLTVRGNSLIAGGSVKGTILEQIITILDEADQHYNEYCTKDEWKVTKTSVYANSCWNCGGQHGLNHCSKPKDQIRIDKAKAVFNKDRPAYGGTAPANGNCNRNGGNGGGNNNRPNNNGGGDRNNVYEKRGQFRRPDGANDIGRKVAGKVYCACKTCGWNTGDTMHTSGYHSEAVKDSAFCLPTNHPVVLKFGTSGGAKKSDTPSNNGGSKKSAGSVNLAALASSCEKFERETENENEANLAGILKRILDSMGKD